MSDAIRVAAELGRLRRERDEAVAKSARLVERMADIAVRVSADRREAFVAGYVAAVEDRERDDFGKHLDAFAIADARRHALAHLDAPATPDQRSTGEAA